MSFVRLKCAVIILNYCISVAYSYEILAVLPFPSPSHHAVTDSFLHKLASMGHSVTIYTPYPRNNRMVNLVEHDIGNCLWSVFDTTVRRNDIVDMKQHGARFKILLSLYTLGEMRVPDRAIESCPPLYELLNSTKKFDLLFYESFLYDLPLLFANKFRIPFVAFNSLSMSPWLALRMQNPLNPAHIAHFFSGHESRMTFFERVDNTLMYLISVVLYQFHTLRRDDELNKRLLGSNAPSLYDVVKNTGVLLLNSHHSFGAVGPLLPGVVEIGGIHILPVEKLPRNIEKFINESEHGVVYFCMGSLLRGETFPKEKRDAFLYAFSKIPQRVLWKWEGDTLPGKSDNIMTSKWMPQRDILAHPNVKLFISHGGLLGTSEAVYEGVPVLGIPIFGDQRTNIRSLEANGAGELLDYSEISKEVVLEKILKLTTNPKYKENAKALSDRYRDRPMSPLDTAVYWTEYVIRHKGAPHLKSAAVELTWYQYLLLDVIAFLVVVFAAVIFFVYYIMKLIVKGFCNVICGSSKSSKSSSSKSSAKSSKKTN